MNEGLKDLSPRKDPKGGSPKSPPRGIPVREYQETYQEQPPISVVHHNGSAAWRAISFGLLGLLGGVTLAWLTAFHERGVTRIEMEEYTRSTHTEMEQHIRDSLPKYLTRPEMELYVKDYSPWVFDKQFIITRLAGHDQADGALQQKIDLVAKLLEEQRGKSVQH